MLGRLIRAFINVNRASARWLERRAPGVFAGVDCYAPLCSAIDRTLQTEPVSRILEIGGIDRPLLRKSPDYEYIGVDIESFADTDRTYDRFFIQSIEQPVDVAVDLAISNTVLEHIPNNRLAISNIFGALRNGGSTHHYVPSKWHPYSILLRLIGPKAQRYLISQIRPEAMDVSGYVAFFNQCSPAEMRAQFGENGFVDIEIRCFYRANGYFDSFLPLYIVVSLYENACRLAGAELLASGYVISARRPGKSTR